ncbi:uncharacterized protein LOC110466603 [Mizuhopecten yessoensis]|uniref:IgGFc-binding protein N-terminal domain-containing protein n=1 Tax=Mizuhopecten yessoensis TaxID=6573 RepID=A0A210PNU9_MIZYE|nr:uncharacterized protein LOC110466603 [Mizuhopecten yessoensis]OWF38116.1 hypothetical protein KP79_PYT08856 [Mizuhopecten yessoensis]
MPRTCRKVFGQEIGYFRWISILLILYSKKVWAVTRTQQATFLCFGNNSDSSLLHFTFRVLANSDNVVGIVPYDASSSSLGVGKRTGCTTVEGNGTAISPLELTITVDTDDLANVATMSNTCGVQEITTGVKYKFRIRTIGDLDLDIGTDAYYDCECDMANLLRGWQTVGPAFAVGMTSMTLQEVQVGAVMRLVDKATDLPVTVVELGADVYLQVVYNPQAQDSNAFDSCGTSFWVAFDRVSANAARSHDLIILSATTLKSQVLFWNTSTSQVFEAITVDPSSSARVSVPGSASGAAMLVTSTEKIYIMTYSSWTGGKSLQTIYPTDTLGSLYHLVSSNDNNFVIIIATDDQTAVNVTSTHFSVSIGGTNIPAGSTDSRNLQTFEALHIYSNNDLLGTIISSSKPVAVFTGFDTPVAQNKFGIQQSLSREKLGTTFIIPTGAGNVKCVASQSGATTIRFASSQLGSADNTTQLNQHEQLNLNSDGEYFFELKSSGPVSCLKIYGEETVVLIPPLQQWSNVYVLDVGNSNIENSSVYFVIMNGSESALKLNQESITAQKSAVHHLSSGSDANDLIMMVVKLPAAVSLPVTVSHPSETFLALLVLDNGTDVVAATVPPGIHLADLYVNGDPSCSKTSGYRGDLVDNDCDGWVDEDTDLDTDNSFPDVPASLIDNLHPIRVRPRDCVAKPNNVWGDGDISKMVIHTSGCLPTGSDVSPFTPYSTFNMTSDSTTFPVVYNTGSFYMPRFENQADVYFLCKLDFCFRFDDASCTTSICQTRTRRTADSNAASSVVGLKVTVTEKQSRQSDSSEDRSQSAEEYCMEDHDFIGVIGVFGCLTFVALGVTSYLFCRVRNTLKRDKY